MELLVHGLAAMVGVEVIDECRHDVADGGLGGQVVAALVQGRHELSEPGFGDPPVAGLQAWPELFAPMFDLSVVGLASQEHAGHADSS